MKRLIRPLTLLSTLVLAATALTLTGAPKAEAHNFTYGWWGCSHAGTLNSRSVNLSYTNTNPFPADGTGDGVQNSWKNRVSASAASWNSALRAARPQGGGRAYGLNFPGTVFANADIAINYIGNAPAGAALGLTFIPNCNMEASGIHTARFAMSKPVEINIYGRLDYFTQNNDRISYWEGCTSRGDTTSYTCSKIFDGGGTIIHELGHALSIPHPEDVDAHIGGGSTAARSAALCSNAFDKHTMCANPTQRRANFRTLESWDLTSLGYAVN